MLVGSLWRKALVMLVAIGAFVWLYQATMLDSRDAARWKLITEAEPNPAPAPGSQLVFTATAYCKGQVTSTGVAPRRGVIAADLALLPLGSVVQIDSREALVDGIYTVLDTGPDIQGRRIDLYMWSCNDALQFGRQTVSLTVLRLGWNPRATTRSFMERLFNPTEVEVEPEAAIRVPSLPSPEERASDTGLSTPSSRGCRTDLEVEPTTTGEPDADTSSARSSSFFLLHRLVLQLEQLEVDAALGQQLLMRALLAHDALVQHQDLVHVLDRRQAVGDGDRRPARHQHAERITNEQLGLGIDAGRRFVEDEDARVERQRTRKRQQLLLAD